jgi:hypothetical protein
LKNLIFFKIKKFKLIKYSMEYIKSIKQKLFYFGDWGLGIGGWGLGPIPNPQSPIPNPQSPIKKI